MRVYILLGLLVMAVVFFVIDKLLTRHYAYRAEVKEAQKIEHAIYEVISSAPGSSFYLSYLEDCVWLTGVSLLKSNVPLPVWQRLLKLLMNSKTVSVEFIMRRKPPVDIKLTKKNSSN